jgi:hypothetical protein
MIEPKFNTEIIKSNGTGFTKMGRKVHKLLKTDVKNKEILAKDAKKKATAAKRKAARAKAKATPPGTTPTTKTPPTKAPGTKTTRTNGTPPRRNPKTGQPMPTKKSKNNFAQFSNTGRGSGAPTQTKSTAAANAAPKPPKPTGLPTKAINKKSSTSTNPVTKVKTVPKAAQPRGRRK